MVLSLQVSMMYHTWVLAIIKKSQKSQKSMNPKIVGDVTLMFIRSGTSKKGNPYLMMSNGRAEIFLDVPKDQDMSQFEKFQEGEMVKLTVEAYVGTDRVKFVA